VALKETMLKSQRALTVAQIAALLSVSERQVYKLVQTGEIPHFKVGASVRFDPLLISNWMEQQTAAHPGLPVKKTHEKRTR
jgi:excisionase family DNA binding protein